MEPEFIDTTLALQKFLDSLPAYKENWPSLYTDLEGNDLCRRGTLSLLTVLVQPLKTVHIVDVTTLGREAFTTAGADGRTLKSILESEDIIKVFFDIRNDSDALFSHFGVRVAGIEDLQLLELASRGSSKRLVHGLAKCIENDADIGYQEKREWREVKEQGRRLFAPERGGSYAVFDIRPLPTEMKKYCAQDVLLLPGLRDIYLAKLCDAWWSKIRQETLARIGLSQSPTYNGKGRHMAEGPRGWMTWRPTADERQCRVLVEKKRMGTGSNAASAPTLQSSTAVPSGSTTTTFRAPSNAFDLSATLQSASGYGSRMERHNEPDDDFVSEWRELGREYESDGDSPRDLTACDKECGYCGKCMY